MRDSRINRIFEGSTEIMHLFLAREAVDRHFQVAGALVDPKASSRERMKALPRIAAFYAAWYPTRFLGWSCWPKYREFGKLAGHLRFAERTSRKLSRAIFYGMLLHRAGLARKQAFLSRVVKAGIDLFAVSAAVTRADRMARDGRPNGREAVELADLFCRMARRRVKGCFRELWRNDDGRTYRTAMNVLDGRHSWLEEDSAGT